MIKNRMKVMGRTTMTTPEQRKKANLKITEKKKGFNQKAFDSMKKKVFK